VLGSHPDVFSTPEVFHDDPRIESDVDLATRVNFFDFLERDPAAYVRRGSSFAAQDQVFLEFLSYLRGLSPARYIVIDVKYNSTHHLDGPWQPVSGPPAFFSILRRHRVRVLHLTRRNYLRFYLSFTQAELTKTWFAHAPTDECRVVVDVPKLLDRMWACRAESEAVDRSLAGYDNCLTVEYDDVFAVPGGGPAPQFLDQVGRWLSIDPESFARQPRYRKQSMLTLRERIENYDAVEQALRGTPFEYCLEDERIYRQSVGHPPE